MPPSIGRLSASASSHPSLSLEAFITNIAESDFRHTQVEIMGQTFEGALWWEIVFFHHARHTDKSGKIAAQIGLRIMPIRRYANASRPPFRLHRRLFTASAARTLQP
jgi:hypothetical protein